MEPAQESELVYHGATLRLLDRPVRFSQEAVQILEEKSLKSSVPFPASFIEWYSIDCALEVLSEIFEEDSLGSLELTEDGVLELPGCQCQGGYHFIRVDDGDDPTVFGKEWESEPIAGPSFSDFIFALAWDYCCEIDMASVGLSRHAISEPERSFLSKQFTECATTHWRGILTRRFQHRNGMLTISEGDDQGSTWVLSAKDADPLLALVRMLSPLDIQAETVLASHPEFQRKCPGCKSLISVLAEKCGWCGTVSE